MKQRKPFKMFVPGKVEINADDPVIDCIYKVDNNYFSDSYGKTDNINCIYEFTRQEIHELVQKKAVELGWEFFLDDYDTDDEYIYLHSDGYLCTWEQDYDQFQEISWQDFLKLTPGDVEAQDDILDQEDVDQICRVAMRSGNKENNNIELTTTDRNEKAWDMLKVIVASRPHDPSQRLVNITEAIDYADDFIRISNANIKQAGDK